jgi:hypothetical protein
MVIGLDIDGTITRHREFFAFLPHSATKAGHQIIVMTFRQERESTMADLAKWGIAYSRLLTWSLDDCLPEEMTAWKGRVCDEFKVELLFEDDPQVISQVDPAVVSMMVVDHDEYELARLTR